MTETDLESHAGRFRTMIDRRFREYGAKHGLPETLKAALRATPRHRFVHRFRLKDDSALHDFDAEPDANWPLVYTDVPMLHVDGDGRQLPSSNSQPSYVLWLLHMLGVEPGQRVLEIGSGSGWLAAIMGRLVGPEGRVTGIEIIADLAEQSRRDLKRHGAENVAILTGDGTGPVAGGPFDRVMVTAATWDITSAILENVADCGRLLVPILQRGGGCQVTLLRREGSALLAERSVPGFFVPLVGPEQQAEQPPEPLAAALRDRGLDSAPTATWPLPLARQSADWAGAAALGFAAFLRIVEPHFVTLASEDGREPLAFGLLDEQSGSLAICRRGALEAYGSRDAAERLAEAFLRWADLGMPGPAAYDLSVYRAAGAPTPDATTHVERRGDCALVWRPKANLGAWRTLLKAP